MHLMENQDDLDVFEGNQAVITHKADQSGKEGLENFISNIMRICEGSLPTMLGQMPLELWQRAAYEAHSLAQRDPTEFNKGKAGIIWLHVRFIQDSLRLGRSMLENDALRKEAADRGWAMPEIPEE